MRVLLPAFTGTGDLYWYVKADSPIKSVKDITDKHTIAYSTNGSSSNNLVLAFGQELGVKAKPTATGSPPGTLTSVMSGQIDLGWASPPFGMKEIKEGKIRIIHARQRCAFAEGTDGARDHRQCRCAEDEERRDHAFREGVSRERRLDVCRSEGARACTRRRSRLMKALLKDAIAEFHPKEALQSDKMADLDGAVADAVKLKFLDAPLTKEQLAEFLQIPPR